MKIVEKEDKEVYRENILNLTTSNELKKYFPIVENYNKFIEAINEYFSNGENFTEKGIEVFLASKNFGPMTIELTKDILSKKPDVIIEKPEELNVEETSPEEVNEEPKEDLEENPKNEEKDSEDLEESINKISDTLSQL